MIDIQKVWMMKNSKGKHDAALTLLVVSFSVVTLAYIASVIGELTFGDITISFKDFDTSYATAVLMPIAALYFGRRFSDSYNKSKNNKNSIKTTTETETFESNEEEEIEK